MDLIYGNVSVSLPRDARIHLHPALSAQAMLEKLEELFPAADALLMAAAVSDWRPKEAADHKLKKQAGVEEMTLQLVKNPDLLKTGPKRKGRTKWSSALRLKLMTFWPMLAGSWQEKALT